MSKLVRLDPKYYPNEDFGHWCPGCNAMHEIAVSKKNASNASWSFDGNFAMPTFSVLGRKRPKNRRRGSLMFPA